MKSTSNHLRYVIDLNFEEIKLPPFRDILILTKNAPQGKIGLSKSFEMIIPNGFEIVEINDELVEAVYINKNLLSKLSEKQILNILKDKVFPFVSNGELIRVDFRVSMSYTGIEISNND